MSALEADIHAPCRAFRRGGWADLVREPEFVLSDPGAHFNVLTGEGVLFVNAVRTRTGDEHLAAHRSLWKPVLDYMLGKLARNNQPVVFLLLGGEAKGAFCAVDPVCNRSTVVDTAHQEGGGSSGAGTLWSV